MGNRTVMNVSKAGNGKPGRSAKAPGRADAAGAATKAAPPKGRRQRGGTLVGLIIGVVLGLGMGLAVAVYVTKVPIPFVDRGPARTPEQDAAEARKNKDWDPNAPLYGKPPLKPIMPAGSASAPGAAPGAAPAATGTAATPPTLAPAASADPIGDLAKAKAALAGTTPAQPAATPAPPSPAAATAPAPGVDPFSYFVQVGAYRSMEDAEGQRAKLSLGGIEARVSEREQSGRSVYRVRVGPFDKREEADRTKERLEALGMEAALVRVQR